MALIPLRNRGGMTVAFARVDDRDFERLCQFRWHLTERGYVRRNASRYEWRGGSTRSIRLHREVLGLARSDLREVDHISGDKLDNRRVNLRLVTRAEQLQNYRTVRGRSQHMGVGWVPRKQRWIARSADGKGGRVTIGLFRTEADAARAVVEYRATHLPFSAEAAVRG